jgi:hypothetical protein
VSAPVVAPPRRVPRSGNDLDERWHAAFLGAVLESLENPATWAASLAGFLARGGILVFLLPIVVLPTPAGIQVDLAPLLVPFVFGQTSPDLIVLIGVVVTLVFVWLVVGGLVGASTDVALVRQATEGADQAVPLPPVRRAVARALAARALAHIPLAVTLALGAARIVEVAYRELVTPFEVTTPLMIRIVSAVPEALLAVLIAWLLGEAAGGLAVREIVLANRRVASAVVRGWFRLFARPITSLATLVLADGLVLAAIPALAAATAAWSGLRTLLYERGRPEGVVLALVLFVALWLGGLVLAGAATSVRGNGWTREWLRTFRPAPQPEIAPSAFGAGTIADARGTDRGG